MVVLDTCALVEVLKPSPSFSEKTATLVDAGATILSISFAEIACKIKLGKLELSTSSRELFRMFNETKHVHIKDVGVNEWLDSIELKWDENRDPADRVITAFAMKNELSIVTTDKKIQEFYPGVIW